MKHREPALNGKPTGTGARRSAQRIVKRSASATRNGSPAVKLSENTRNKRNPKRVQHCT